MPCRSSSSGSNPAIIFRWSCLLHELTGETPDYEPEVEGEILKFDVNAAAEAWLKWGKQHGYLI